MGLIYKVAASIRTGCDSEKCVLSQEEEERRHQELLAKRKVEEEREKARKQAEAARALELKKEQERERERERQREERERERERQAAAERLVLKTHQVCIWGFGGVFCFFFGWLVFPPTHTHTLIFVGIGGGFLLTNKSM